MKKEVKSNIKIKCPSPVRMQRIEREMNLIVLDPLKVLFHWKEVAECDSDLILDVKLHGKLAKKCIEETKNFTVNLNGLYNEQDLFRWAWYNKFTVKVSPEREHRKVFYLHEYIIINNYLFEAWNFTGNNYHLTYKLLGKVISQANFSVKNP